jgi:hypothetical protein
MEMELFQPLNSTNQELSSLERRKGKISLLKKGQKENEENMESYFILFHYRRYDVTGSPCVCLPVSLQDLTIKFFSFSPLRPSTRHGVISYIIIGSEYYHLECPGPVNRVFFGHISHKEPPASPAGQQFDFLGDLNLLMTSSLRPVPSESVCSARIKESNKKKSGVVKSHFPFRPTVRLNSVQVRLLI